MPKGTFDIDQNLVRALSAQVTPQVSNIVYTTSSTAPSTSYSGAALSQATSGTASGGWPQNS